MRFVFGELIGNDGKSLKVVHTILRNVSCAEHTTGAVPEPRPGLRAAFAARHARFCPGPGTHLLPKCAILLLYTVRTTATVDREMSKLDACARWLSFPVPLSYACASDDGDSAAAT